MEQTIFSGMHQLYSTTREAPLEIRIKVRMRDSVDPSALRAAVDTAMKRYPYFCVELQNKNGQYVYAENSRPVVLSHSQQGVELNSEESNLHMIAFAWYDDWIIMDVFHGLTDGTGAYAVIRTLLYYYCTEKYGVHVTGEGIRLAGDEIPQAEWEDPVLLLQAPPPHARIEMPKALNPVDAAGLQADRKKTVSCITVSESEFMRFNIENDGSPGTMVALFLSRAIGKLFPDADAPIRTCLCVNQRGALHAPLAHHSLVGGAMLEYVDKIRDWSIDHQATAFRGMVFAQTQEEAVLAGVSGEKELSQTLINAGMDQIRLGIIAFVKKATSEHVTATVSYVGKADFKEMEQYIRDFHLWTSAVDRTILVEISAVHGRFILDFIQPFSDPVILNAFLRELEENGIAYELQGTAELALPNIKLPWSP